MENIKGQNIPAEKVEEVEKRISGLSKEKIDELFYRVGFVVSYPDREGNKALTPHQLSEIKKGDSAVTNTMIWETPFELVMVNLRELEGKEPNARDKMFHRIRNLVSDMSPLQIDEFFHEMGYRSKSMKDKEEKDTEENYVHYNAIDSSEARDISQGEDYKHVDRLIVKLGYENILEELEKEK